MSAATSPLTQGLEAMAASTLADRYDDPQLVADIVPRYGLPAPWPAHRGIGGVVLEWRASAAGLQTSSRYGDLQYHEQLQATRGLPVPASHFARSRKMLTDRAEELRGIANVQREAWSRESREAADQMDMAARVLQAAEHFEHPVEVLLQAVEEVANRCIDDPIN